MENLQVARLYSQDSITICQQNQMFSKIQQMDLDRALAKQLRPNLMGVQLATNATLIGLAIGSPDLQIVIYVMLPIEELAK